MYAMHTVSHVCKDTFAQIRYLISTLCHVCVCVQKKCVGAQSTFLVPCSYIHTNAHAYVQVYSIHIEIILLHQLKIIVH